MLKRLDQYASPDRGWSERALKPRDRLAAVYFAGNTHEEAQPVHLKVLARKIQSLPTLPRVVEKLMTMVESPDVSPKDVGKLISSDQVLGARVLRLVNSPFYGFPGRISSISHAIILLGFNVIKGVVLSASVFDLMERTMVGLWEH